MVLEANTNRLIEKCEYEAFLKALQEEELDANCVSLIDVVALLKELDLNKKECSVVTT